MSEPIDEAGEGGYRYRAQHGSLLEPFIRRALWDPLLRHVPQDASPNTLTLFGAVFAFATVPLALTSDPERRGLHLLGALCIAAYATLDNIDGAQARRSGRSSPLGEFLDHGLDTFNQAFVTLGVCVSLGMAAGSLLAVITSTVAAFFGAFWEQAHTGLMRTGPLADIEGNVMAVLLFVALAVVGVDGMHTPLIAGWSAVDMVVVFTVVNAGITLSGPLRRQRAGASHWIPLLAGMVSVWGAWLWVPGHGLAHAAIIGALLPSGALVLLGVRLPAGAYAGDRRGAWLAGALACVGPLAGAALGGDAREAILWGVVAALGLIGALDFRKRLDAFRPHVRRDELLARFLPPVEPAAK